MVGPYISDVSCSVRREHTTSILRQILLGWRQNAQFCVILWIWEILVNLMASRELLGVTSKEPPKNYRVCYVTWLIYQIMHYEAIFGSV